MRLCAAVLATTLLATAGGAGEVGFPLVVDHALLRATLARQLGEEPDGSSVLGGSRGGCRSLVLRDLRVGAAAGRMRVSAQGRAHLGVRFLGFCFARLAWSGRVESLARPEMGDDWRLRLRGLDSQLYDAAGRRPPPARRLWDFGKGSFRGGLASLTFDPAPPGRGGRGPLRAVGPPAPAPP